MGQRMTRFSWVVAVGLAALAPSAARATANDDGTTGSFSNLNVFNFTTGLSTHDVLVSQQSNGNAWTCAGLSDSTRLSTGHPRYQQMHDALIGLSLSKQKYTVTYQVVASVCWIKQITLQGG
jgi:hypothetical protein